MKESTFNPRNAEKRLVIVDDDHELREDLIDYLTMQGYDVSGVGTASECYMMFILGSYDLAIVDVGLPDQSGLVLVEYLRKNTDVRIVILSAHVDSEERLAGYDAGADIYMLKPVDSRELSSSIANILRRTGPEHPVDQMVAENQMTADNHEIGQWRLFVGDWSLQTPNGDRVQLTAKEFDLLNFMATQHLGALVRRLDILDRLAYQRDEYGSRAFESMVYRLRHKMEALNCELPLRNYRGVGYCLSSPVFCM